MRKALVEVVEVFPVEGVGEPLGTHQFGMLRRPLVPIQVVLLLIPIKTLPALRMSKAGTQMMGPQMVVSVRVDARMMVQPPKVAVAIYPHRAMERITGQAATAVVEAWIMGQSDLGR